MTSEVTGTGTESSGSQTSKKEEHVHFDEEDIARKEGKEHIDFPKTHAVCQDKNTAPHVTFTGEDIARKAGKEHVDYPKTHAAPAPVSDSVPDSSKDDSSTVRFSGDAIARKEGKSNKKRNVHISQQGSSPTKVKVSKEDFLLHVKIFGFIIMSFLIKVIYDHKKGYYSQTTKNKKSTFRQELEKIEKSLEKKVDLIDPELPQSIFIPSQTQNSRTDIVNDKSNGSENKAEEEDTNGPPECSLYLTRSSIPSTDKSNFGVFATKSFQEGDVLFHSGKSISMAGMDLSVHIMLMKQHPNLGNVKWTKQNGVVAKKDIKAGEEIFIDFRDFQDADLFENVYHSILHKDDPLREDYETADSILNEVMDAIPHKKVYESNRKAYKQRAKKVAKLVPSIDAGRILTIIKNNMSKYNNKLGRLIPDTTVKASSVKAVNGTARFISNHRSVKWITSHGICLNGLSTESSCPAKQAMMAEEGIQGAFTTRSVSKGETIETAPLFAMKLGVNSIGTNCIDAPVEDIVLCPLSSVSSARMGAQCMPGMDECPRDMTNAFYEWSKWNVANENVNNMSAEEFMKKPLTGLTLDIVASRDVAHNSEVFIDFSM